MAEFIAQIDEGYSYEPHDIIHVFTDTDISKVHCHHICHVDNFGFNSNGLRPESLASDLRRNTFQYLFQRVSQNTLIRHSLLTGEQIEFSNIPKVVDGISQYIDIPYFLDRHRRYHTHQIFGEPGAEYWFGGNQYYDKLDKVWDCIHDKTSLRHKDDIYQKYPHKEDILRRYLCVKLDSDITIEEKDAYLSPLIEKEEIVKLRQYKSGLELSIKNRFDIRDELIPKDIIRFKEINGKHR